MSVHVPVSFTEKFKDDFIHLSQQKRSRLRRTVRDDPDMLQGRFGYFDRIGATEMQQAQGRHADTQLVNVPHSRRRITLADFDWAEMIDKKDMRRMIGKGSLPARYRHSAVMAANRKQDDIIIAAASADAYAIDEDGTATTVPFPSEQRVGLQASGLTLDKLHQAREILEGNEVDEDEDVYFLISTKQKTNLLNTTEVKSAEYNAVKTLVDGKVNNFMGFEFIRTERLALSGSTRTCLAYASSGIGLAVGQEIEVDIGPRRDKRNATQVYLDMGLDGTRIEDEKVVEILCKE